MGEFRDLVTTHTIHLENANSPVPWSQTLASGQSQQFTPPLPVGATNTVIEKILGQLGGFLHLIDDFVDKGADPCANHAERKVIRYAYKTLLLGVGASRPVCLNCQAALWPVVGPYYAPIGTKWCKKPDE